jgi:hypothetical protein
LNFDPWELHISILNSMAKVNEGEKRLEFLIFFKSKTSKKCLKVTKKNHTYHSGDWGSTDAKADIAYSPNQFLALNFFAVPFGFLGYRRVDTGHFFHTSLAQGLPF